MWLGKASFCDPNVFSSSYLPDIVICRLLFTQKMQAELFYSDFFFTVNFNSDSDSVEKQTFQRRPTPCISSKWPKNSMQSTLVMPFVGVLVQFYRNRKGLICSKF